MATYPTFTQLKSFLRQWGLPLLACTLLCVLVAVTPPRDPHVLARTSLQTFAHNLGHAINSVWVGISLLLLVVPSLVSSLYFKKPNAWAWRAVDAIFLDFLAVDVLGKDLFTGLGRPGRADQPGFPSGHATMAFLMACLIWQRYPKLGPLWFGMATLISWSRVESHAHYPYQVIAGMIYGCAFSALIMTRRVGVLLPRVLLSETSLRRLLASKSQTVQS